MTDQKMIDERTKIISDICPFYKEYGTCEQCNTDLDIDDEPCFYGCMANEILMNGYRTQSDIASEIIEEFKDSTKQYLLTHDLYPVIFKHALEYAELKIKKKYMETKVNEIEY